MFGVEKYGGTCGEGVADWGGGDRTEPVGGAYDCASGTEFVGAVYGGAEGGGVGAYGRAGGTY